MFCCMQKRLIVVAAVLAIFLAQFAVLVHATDHPFHQEDTLCLSFQSAAHDKHFFNHIPFVVFTADYIVELAPQLVEFVALVFDSNYFSRAPPVNNA